MSQKRKTKEEIVAEYLTGNYTYRELGLKYDIPFRSICDWVFEYQGRKPTWREKMKRKRDKETGVKEPELPNEVKLLHKELATKSRPLPQAPGNRGTSFWSDKAAMGFLLHHDQKEHPTRLCRCGNDLYGLQPPADNKHTR